MYLLVYEKGGKYYHEEYYYAKLALEFFERHEVDAALDGKEINLVSIHNINYHTCHVEGVIEGDLRHKYDDDGLIMEEEDDGDKDNGCGHDEWLGLNPTYED